MKWPRLFTADLFRKVGHLIPAVYLRSPVWDFGGGSYVWNWTETEHM